MKTQIKFSTQLSLRMNRTNDLAQTLINLSKEVAGKGKVSKDNPLSCTLKTRLMWIENEINNHDTRSNVFDVAEYGCDGWTQWATNLRELCVKIVSADGFRERLPYYDAAAIETAVNEAIATFPEFQRVIAEEIEVTK